MGRIKHVVWLELKDLGRNAKTMQNNCKGLGHDLAALATINVENTIQTWISPPSHVIDRGRIPEWTSYAQGMVHAKHWIGQIVISSLSLEDHLSPAEVKALWLGEYSKRTGLSSESVHISDQSTRCFRIYSLLYEI
jgi:hypothetical protein